MELPLLLEKWTRISSVPLPCSHEGYFILTQFVSEIPSLGFNELEKCIDFFIQQALIASRAGAERPTLKVLQLLIRAYFERFQVSLVAMRMWAHGSSL